MTTTDHDLEELLGYLRATRGFDFGGYKRTTLERRIAKRLAIVGCDAYVDYADYLEVHPEEFGLLFNLILINVTAFFRDPATWDHLTASVLPALPPEGPIRVWCAGCASGEEAYTLAMLLAEHLGADDFATRVKIYGTDVDDDALATARLATYADRDVENVPEDLRSRWFERVDGGLRVRKDLRRAVIFGRHDLLTDAPISRLDLLTCRNTLMYFNAEAQAGVLERFHFALNEGGTLVLGKAETLLAYSSLFKPLELRYRIFASVRARARVRVPGAVRPPTPGALAPASMALVETAFEVAPRPAVIVDGDGYLAFANAAAHRLFLLTDEDIGRPLSELEISYRPADLRTAIELAVAQRRLAVVEAVEWHQPGRDVRRLDVEVAPLLDGAGRPAVAVTFTDVTELHRLRAAIETVTVQLESAYEEVQSTNEELETTNEELQSAIEELETTNEELQSTNEELETMNEELQSTNEELHTINEELQTRSDELNEVNGFLEAILTSMRGGVMVLDRDLIIRVWNARATDLWGLRADEVRGTHVWNLDIGLPVEDVRTAIKSAMADDPVPTEVLVRARDRRGREDEYRITVSPLQGLHQPLQGVILIMEPSSETA